MNSVRKGLENDAVIIIDLPSPNRDNSPLSSHYVAMSRARIWLKMIYLS